MACSRRRFPVFTVALAAVALAAVAYRLTWTPEWTVLTGTEAERQEACRSVYRKSPARAGWCLERLLSDSSPAVRIPALEALVHRPDLHGRFAATVHGLARGADPHVRARAIEYFFQHDGALSADLISQARADLEDPVFRDQHPGLTAAVLSAALARGQTDVVDWVVGLVERGAVGDTGAFQAVVRHPDLLRPFRGRLVSCLGTSGPAVKAFVVAALTAIDGRMRGTAPDDWRDTREDVPGSAAEPLPVNSFTVEGEWAHRLQPNFQIDRTDGELGLHLGEGAGGDHFWRRQRYSTVDIGKAHFTFTLSKSDRYQLWFRCWFSDKCGNHSLLHVDGRWLRWRAASHDDKYDRLQQWHWKRIETNVALSAGQHTVTLTAGDDGLVYDKLALLPAGQRFDPVSPPPLRPLFDPALPSSVSISTEAQSQVRGTTQTVTVWVRRNSARITSGEVRLAVPAPFEVLGADTARVAFAAGSAVAGAPFRVHAPTTSVGGEGDCVATFSVDGKQAAVGSMILGLTYDWYTTGPLNPSDPRCLTLSRQQSLSDADLAEGWQRYPAKGYDRYRRLDFERAFGQQHNVCIFLYTEIDVVRGGQFESFLTLDDSGVVTIDGKRVAGRREAGVGEGWMLVDNVALAPGRHRVFAWVYQADFPEPSGPDAGRHTPNHWVFKWLLRESRHRAAPQIRGVVVEAGSRGGGKRKTEDGRGKTEDGRGKTEDGRGKTEDGKRARDSE